MWSRALRDRVRFDRRAVLRQERGRASTELDLAEREAHAVWQDGLPLAALDLDLVIGGLLPLPEPESERAVLEERTVARLVEQRDRTAQRTRRVRHDLGRSELGARLGRKLRRDLLAIDGHLDAHLAENGLGAANDVACFADQTM